MAQLNPITLPPYNWLIDARVFNKNFEPVPYSWIAENADVVVLLFTSKGVDRNGILQKFCEIYENVKYINMPIEVINIPMDENTKDMWDCYGEQANWFTLRVDDPLVLTLQYMYEITCIPHIIVQKPDGTMISTHGIQDLEEYGKNAIITWMTTSASMKTGRRMSKDANMYGKTWSYLNSGLSSKKEYQGRFSVAMPPIPSPRAAVRTETPEKDEKTSKELPAAS
ncbi:uncharacterized protein [Choristoneura fumiferana]|uniref:uncharacterized protein n=1 Tax=Choristoneura fumiferana TaxID=7141 RepID=UPI003D1599FB